MFANIRLKNFLTYLLLFLLPWQTRWILRPGELNGGYWEYGTISIYITEVILWLAIFLHVVSKNRLISNFDPTGHHPQGDKFLILTLRVITRRVTIFNQFLNSKIKKYFLLLIAYSLLLGLVSLRPDLYYYYLLRIVEGFALYFLIKSVDARKASLVFILGMIPQALLGIYQFLIQLSFGNSWLGMAVHDPATLGTFVVETVSGRWLRAYGSLPHPNIFGGYVVVAIMLLVNLMLDSRGKKFQNKLLVISYLLLVIFSAGLFFTFSRSAWLALFIVLLSHLFISPLSNSRQRRAGARMVNGRFAENKKRVICYLLFVICSFVVLGSIFKDPLLSRAQGDNRLETKSKIERIMGYEEAWQLFKKHPLVGVGLGNYTYAAYKEIDSLSPSFAYQPVHNIFVLLVVEAGILGILAIFSLFIYWFLRVRSTALIFASVFVIVLGLFDHYLLSLYPGIMLLFSTFALRNEEFSQTTPVNSPFY